MVKIDLYGDIIPDMEEVIEKPKTASPFDFIKNIGSKKYPDSFEGYNQWIINTALSMRKDTAIFANEMNKYTELSDHEQHDFYFHMLPKRAYFAKWAKAPKEESITKIAEYYKVSEVIAKQYARVLTDDQVKQITDELDFRKGGKRSK